MPRHRLGLASICLHISAVLYFAIGVLVFPLFLTENEGDRGFALAFAAFMAVFCLILIVGIEFVAVGLANRRYWALHLRDLRSVALLSIGRSGPVGIA